MIIDSHAHVILPVEKHIALMDETGVDKTILFSTTIHPEIADNVETFKQEMGILNEIISGKRNSIDAKLKSIKEQHSIIEKYSSRFYGFGTAPVGLDYEQTATWIDNYVIKNNFIGLGEFTVASGQISALDTVFQASHDFSNLPIWIHAFWPLNLEDIKEIFNLSKRYPDVPVIIGHLGGVNWTDVIAFAKENKNIYIDLSGAYAWVALKIAISEIPERCLFSSDLPYGDLMSSKFSIERACNDVMAREQVLGGNIAKLLKL